MWVLRYIAYSLWLLIRFQLLLASCAISKPKLLKFAKLHNCWGIPFLVLISCHITVTYFRRSLSENVPESLQSHYVYFVISIQRALTESFLTPIVQVYWIYCSSGLDSYFTCISVKNAFDEFSWRQFSCDSTCVLCQHPFILLKFCLWKYWRGRIIPQIHCTLLQCYILSMFPSKWE